MPRSLPLLTQPAPPTPESHGKESIDDPTTGLRGVFEDLGVLLAIMLGYDMVTPQSGGRPRAAARLVPPSRRQVTSCRWATVGTGVRLVSDADSATPSPSPRAGRKMPR